MLVKQISIFLPNQKGNLARVTKLLQEHNIDIRAIVAFDTAEYGILRIIVTEPDLALKRLVDAGYVAKISKVLVVEPEDRTGSLYQLFETLANQELNVDYTYSFTMQTGAMPYFVLKVEDLEKAAEVLSKSGVRVINMGEIVN